MLCLETCMMCSHLSENPYYELGLSHTFYRKPLFSSIILYNAVLWLNTTKHLSVTTAVGQCGYL